MRTPREWFVWWLLVGKLNLLVDNFIVHLLVFQAIYTSVGCTSQATNSQIYNIFPLARISSLRTRGCWGHEQRRCMCGGMLLLPRLPCACTLGLQRDAVWSQGYDIALCTSAENTQIVTVNHFPPYRSSSQARLTWTTGSHCPAEPPLKSRGGEATSGPAAGDEHFAVYPGRTTSSPVAGSSSPSTGDTVGMIRR